MCRISWWRNESYKNNYCSKVDKKTVIKSKIYKNAVTTNRSRYNINKHNPFLIPRIDMGKSVSLTKLYFKLKTIYEDIKFKKHELYL